MQVIKISSISPAPYNPRKITSEQFDRLCLSLRELGFIIPILVNAENNIIIAGHQRTKAAQAVGFSEVPCFMVPKIGPGDEIKFNQLHNAVDIHTATEVQYSGPEPKAGYATARANAFHVAKHNAEYTKEMCKLILKYGNVLCAVVCGGRVIVGGNYVKACQLCDLEVNVSFLAKETLDTACAYLHGNYGEYSYSDIKKETYVQGLAQLFREPGRTDGRKAFSSTLYEHYVIPYLHEHPHISVLDFGCGKGSYVKALQRKFLIEGIEFYNHNGKAIDITMGQHMIDRLIARLTHHGRFDLVVCDSVLNSVDCPEAELNVLRCLNIFSSGKVFVSGRPVDEVLQKINCERSNGPRRRYLQFLDANNFSGTYREGKWYFQHFHTPEQIETAMQAAGFTVDNIWWRRYGNNFQVEAHKARELTAEEVIEAIKYEFNLPLPQGRRYGRHHEVLQAVQPFYRA